MNVHPTKKEVHFLDEDAIIERIADVVQDALIGQSQSRVFEYQVAAYPDSMPRLRRPLTFHSRRCSLVASSTLR